ncbi:MULTISPECIES: TetR/AcrR family transcriptional regulator [Streptomyces]|uniref:Gamma-butyrolactone-binding protein n=1 Tax=Streptomyces xanthochromogenes TaxID=67384 RepID=A0ABQ3AY31_9ACTN|nr:MULTISPECIES: TetR/AcrR family transcriptional regulator [Streptomyces]MYV95922.1 TetR family transcriptional regulator [Streptomyces sp. SID1034]GGY71337.1 gamma-butyrolactone-binding protein [Streptomyces xanthochromogenes]
MARQERAVRTRQTLVDAAASEFDRSGYHGTSLNRVCRAAGITMGALTFHFSAKDELADEVQSQGQLITRQALDGLPERSAPALHRAIDLTLELARLLEAEPVVRSAARLSRERPDRDLAWSAAWLTNVQDLFDQAYHDGQLHSAVRPASLTALSLYLMSGIESQARADHESPDAEPELSAVEQLRQIWGVVQFGICGPPGTGC